MKRTLLSLSFVILATITHAQQKEYGKIQGKASKDTSQIFTAVEQDPSFPGGLERFIDYIRTNLRYPADAVERRIVGKVYVTFVVEKDGSLSDIKVIRGVAPSIDNEALRVVTNSPNWMPGVQNGKAVKVQYTIPISFVLPPPIGPLIDTNKVFTAVEVEPAFPGGFEAFNQYIQKHLRYPEAAKRDNIRGKVALSFIIERDGTLSNIKVLKGLSPELDAEAIRLFSNSPKWFPGMQNGQNIRIAYTLAVNFEPPE